MTSRDDQISPNVRRFSRAKTHLVLRVSVVDVAVLDRVRGPPAAAAAAAVGRRGQVGPAARSVVVVLVRRRNVRTEGRETTHLATGRSGTSCAEKVVSYLDPTMLSITGRNIRPWKSPKNTVKRKTWVGGQKGKATGNYSARR